MEQNTIDGLEPVPAAPVAETTTPEAEAGSTDAAAPIPDLLPVALSLEFLIALIAIPTAWSEIGGQGHLDMMPWYLKMALIVGLSWAFVKFSAALARPAKARKRRAVLWLLALLTITAGMGLVTYYYHLQEPDDEDNSDDNPSTATSLPKRPSVGGYL